MIRQEASTIFGKHQGHPRHEPCEGVGEDEEEGQRMAGKHVLLVDAHNRGCSRSIGSHFLTPPKPRRASPCALQVADPDLEGRQVAVLRLHAASMPRNAGSILLAKAQVCAPQHKIRTRTSEKRRKAEVRSVRSPRSRGPSL